MTGPGKQYDYGTGEKIVNALASGLLWAAKPAIQAIRVVWKLLPTKQDRRTPNEPLNDEDASNR